MSYVKFIILILFLSSFKLVAGDAYKASFDCTDKTKLSAIEQEICKNYYLSRQDAILGKYYTYLKKTLTDEERNDLVAAQKAWLKNRNTTCNEKYVFSCVQESYKNRIKELERLYNKVFLPFDQEQQNQLCNEFADNFPDYFNTHKVSIKDFDVNNDGELEHADMQYCGTLYRPCFQYFTLNGNKIETLDMHDLEDAAYTSIDYVKIDNVFFAVMSDARSRQIKPTLLSYITPLNTQIKICAFSPQDNVYVPNPQVEHSIEVCKAVQNKTIQYIYFPYGNSKKVGKYSVREHYIPIDYDNDGNSNNLHEVEGDIGPNTKNGDYMPMYYDELNPSGTEFSNAKARELLIKLQNLDPAAIYPQTADEGAQGWFFEYDGRTYFRTNEARPKINIIFHNEVLPVCTSKPGLSLKVIDTDKVFAY